MTHKKRGLGIGWGGSWHTRRMRGRGEVSILAENSLSVLAHKEKDVDW